VTRRDACNVSVFISCLVWCNPYRPCRYIRDTQRHALFYPIGAAMPVAAWTLMLVNNAATRDGITVMMAIQTTWWCLLISMETDAACAFNTIVRCYWHSLTTPVYRRHSYRPYSACHCSCDACRISRRVLFDCLLTGSGRYYAMLRVADGCQLMFVFLTRHACLFDAAPPDLYYLSSRTLTCRRSKTFLPRHSRCR